MRGGLLTPYRHGNSRIHRLPPALKLISTMLFIVGVVLLPRGAWYAYACAAALLLVAAAFSRISFIDLGKRLLLLEAFVVTVALLSLLQPNGVVVFLSMLSKSTICLGAMLLLTSTSRFSELLIVLRSLHVPGLLVTTLALMYRYLFVLFDEMGRMHRARRCRTFTRNRWFTWKNSAAIIGHLFVRTSERAERIYGAMCARGLKT